MNNKGYLPVRKPTRKGHPFLQWVVFFGLLGAILAVFCTFSVTLPVLSTFAARQQPTSVATLAVTVTTPEATSTVGPTVAPTETATPTATVTTAQFRKVSDFAEECTVNLNVTPLVATMHMSGTVRIWTPDLRGMVGEYGYLVADATRVYAVTPTQSSMLYDQWGNFVGVVLGAKLYPNDRQRLINNGWAAPDREHRFGWHIRTLDGLLMDGCTDVLVLYNPRLGRYLPH